MEHSPDQNEKNQGLGRIVIAHKDIPKSNARQHPAKDQQLRISRISNKKYAFTVVHRLDLYNPLLRTVKGYIRVDMSISIRCHVSRPTVV
jgi:hypothetical protein